MFQVLDPAQAYAGHRYRDLPLQQKLWLATAERSWSMLQDAPAWLRRWCDAADLVFEAAEGCWYLTEAGAHLWSEMWGPD